jgi:hypothetical protein
MSYFSASTGAIEYGEKSGVHLQTKEKNESEQCHAENS